MSALTAVLPANITCGTAQSKTDHRSQDADQMPSTPPSRKQVPARPPGRRLAPGPPLSRSPRVSGRIPHNPTMTASPNRGCIISDYHSLLPDNRQRRCQTGNISLDDSTAGDTFPSWAKGKQAIREWAGPGLSESIVLVGTDAFLRIVLWETVDGGRSGI